MLTPAQLTRMSTRPWRERIARAESSTASRSVTSTGSASACPPARSMRSCVSASAVARRPVTTTFAPPFASSIAAAWPMPLPPPVTQAIFPASPLMRDRRLAAIGKSLVLRGLQDRRQGRVERGADRAHELPFGEGKSIIGHHHRHAGLDEHRLLQRSQQLQLVEGALDGIEAEFRQRVQYAALDPESVHPL